MAPVLEYLKVLKTPSLEAALANMAVISLLAKFACFLASQL
jgi:hypothetical protein